MSISLHRALLAIIGLAMLAAAAPAWLALDRRLAAELESRARDDLMLAPRVLVDRMAASSDALMMRAKDAAHTPGLSEALVGGNRTAALRLLARAVAGAGPSAEPLLIGPHGEVWNGPPIPDSLIAATRANRVPVVFVSSADSVQRVALAAVLQNGRWVGAAGLATSMDAVAASTFSRVTESEVLIATTAGRVTASTMSDSDAAILASHVQRDGHVHDVSVGGADYVGVAVPLGDAGIVVFARDLPRELAVLPSVRRAAAVSAAVALGIALVLGALLASLVTRPVRQLSLAAERMTDGDFGDARPLPSSSLREVAHVSRALDTMRAALATRLADLRAANAELEDRNSRLVLLQAELMQRDRLAATGRLVTQLAHEIRNPVASVRNLIELLKRRLVDDPEATEFARLAIDELLRMHRLSEQLLDLNRPRDPSLRRAAVGDVAREVVVLLGAGRAGAADAIAVRDADGVLAGIAPDALKQVLLNVLQNAIEASSLDGSRPDQAVSGMIEVRAFTMDAAAVLEVRDSGPGIPETILPRIFDPFFTTKDATNGVGLGLFVAEGIVRAAGGRITAGNDIRGGACIRIELPRVIEDNPMVSTSDPGSVRRFGVQSTRPPDPVSGVSGAAHERG